MQLRRNRDWNLTRAAAAQARRHRDILFSIDAVRYREALHRRLQARLPQCRSGLHIDCAKDTIQIADERQATGC